MPVHSHIVIASPHPAASFVRQDKRLLETEFEVELVEVKGMGSLYGLRRAIARADAVMTWFAGRSAVPAVAMARIQRVPIVTVIGGFEVAWIPELGYGVMPGSLKERVLSWILRSAQRVISVSDYSRSDLVTRFPWVEKKSCIIYNAVDSSRFAADALVSRAGVISVGAITAETIGRKSWSLVRETARQMPQVPFTLVGGVGDQAGREFVKRLPPNMTWRGFLHQKELVTLLQSASVCFQPSVYESFCVSLAEAMACGCVPVVSNRGALPEVVGPTGEILSELNPSNAEHAILRALSTPAARRETIRQRIVELFDISIRRKALCGTFREILTKRT